MSFSTKQSNIQIGNIESALEMTNELLELQPGHERAIGNKLYYEGEIESVKLPKFEYNLRGDDGSIDLDVPVKVSAQRQIPNGTISIIFSTTFLHS